MRYSSRCGDISLYNFDRIAQTSDYRYILPDWDEFSKVDLDKAKAEKIWGEIYGEYCKLMDDNKVFMYFEALVTLNNLKAKKHVVEQLLLLLDEVQDPEVEDLFYDELAKWGFPMDISKPRGEEIKRVRGLVKFFQNKIDLKANEVENLKGDGKPEPLSQQIVRVEKMTKRNNIDPKKISVEKWAFIINDLRNTKRR